MTPEVLLALYERFPDALLIIRSTGQILECNSAAQRLLATTAEAIANQPLLSDWLDDPKQKLSHFLRQCARTQQPIPFALTLRESPARPAAVYMVEGLLLQPRQADNNPAIILLRWRPRQEANQLFTALSERVDHLKREMFLRGQAAEERRQIDLRLQHTQKLESLAVLAGGVAHDFNNLLTSILGYTELSLLKIRPESPAQYSLEKIRQATLRAADLAKQMLTYAGRGYMEMSEINLNQLVEEMTHILKVSISPQINVHFNLAPHLPPVQADPTQLRQVVMNLITNASEAIGDQYGAISFHSGLLEANEDYLTNFAQDEQLEAGWYVYLEVSDTGGGMPEEVQARMFDPFFTTKFTGRGLGLAAVLGIIRGHRGAIKVYSEVGRGTTFKILLPTTSEFIEPTDSEPTQDEAYSHRIFIVDDNEAVQSVTQALLEAYGFTVMSTNDSRESITLFRSHHHEIDLVLLDLTMPHMDGAAVFSAMRQINPKACVVLCSGYSEQGVMANFTGKGLAGYLQKPFTAEKLLSTITQALENKAGGA